MFVYFGVAKIVEKKNKEKEFVLQALGVQIIEIVLSQIIYYNKEVDKYG